MKTLRIATWNINSVRLRLPLLQKVVAEIQPDILCLQETKVMDELFPREALTKLGFPHIAISGQKSYNGVAILSLQPFASFHTQDFLGNQECRHLAAKFANGIELHNFYVPAGGDIPDPEINRKFYDKLRFVDGMTAWSKSLPKKAKAIIVGDLNIAPLEHDVWSHKQLLNVVSHTPIEVEKMTALQKSRDWVDALREFVPADQKLYSWWSYRNHDWKVSNRGRRLDHIWLTPSLRAYLQAGEIHRHVRDWLQPSDHVPVTIDMEWPDA